MHHSQCSLYISTATCSFHPVSSCFPFNIILISTKLLHTFCQSPTLAVVVFFACLLLLILHQSFSSHFFSSFTPPSPVWELSTLLCVFFPVFILCFSAIFAVSVTFCAFLLLSSTPLLLFVLLLFLLIFSLLLLFFSASKHSAQVRTLALVMAHVLETAPVDVARSKTCRRCRSHRFGHRHNGARTDRCKMFLSWLLCWPEDVIT